MKEVPSDILTEFIKNSIEKACNELNTKFNLIDQAKKYLIFLKTENNELFDYKIVEKHIEKIMLSNFSDFIEEKTGESSKDYNSNIINIISIMNENDILHVTF